MQASVILESAQSLFNARRGNVPKPLLSSSVEDLDEKMAYQIQHRYVELISEVDEISGFKGALTNPVAQQMFAATAPASGILFRSGQYKTEAELKMNDFVLPVLETEIGFRVGEKISKAKEPLSARSLRDLIEAVLPMVEVADIGQCE